MHVFKSLCLLLLAGVAIPVAADEHRQHGAHEHGVGLLNISMEGTELHIELDSPAVNIVGFEHAPNSEEEHKSQDSALERLRDGAALFIFPEEAECRLVSADAKTPLEDHYEGEAHLVDEHHEANHEEDEHQDGHDHGGKEGEHDEGHEHGAAHADIDAAWRFTCEHSDRLDRIGVRLFDVFPRTQRLQVQYITERQQGAASLNVSQPDLRF